MERECQQIERDGQSRQMLLAVTDAVLKIVAVDVQDIEGLVFDLPPRLPAGGQVGDRVAVDRRVGDEAVAVGAVSGGVADLDLEPVDLECVAALAQRRFIKLSKQIRDPLAVTLTRTLWVSSSLIPSFRFW